MLVSVAEYKTTIKSDKSDTQITQALSAAQDRVEGYLKYSVEDEWTTETLPDTVALVIKLIAQSILSSIGTGGIAQQVNLGNGGSYTIDNTKYFKYFDLINRYKKAGNIF